MNVDKDELKQFLERIMAFASKTGIAFMTGSIYGGLAGFWDKPGDHFTRWGLFGRNDPR